MSASYHSSFDPEDHYHVVLHTTPKNIICLCGYRIPLVTANGGRGSAEGAEIFAGRSLCPHCDTLRSADAQLLLEASIEASR